MSLQYVTLSNTFNMLPHTMAGHKHFMEINRKREFSSKLLGTSNYLSVSKQNDSDGIQMPCKSDILEKSKNPDCQVVSSNFNGDCSNKESSMKKAFTAAQSFGSCMGNSKIPTIKVVTPENKICDANKYMQCDNLTEENTLELSFNGIQSLGSDIGNDKVSTVDVASLAASNPSNGASKEIGNVNSSVAVTVADSSLFKTETNGLLVEGCYFDSHINEDSLSKDSDTSDQGSKVVVQTLSNVVSSEASFVESCFDINGILEKKPSEKKWSPEIEVGPIEQSDKSTRCSFKEENASDVYQQGNLFSKAKRKMRKSHEMNFHIRPGKGVRLHDISHIVTNVEFASPSLLGFLHKVLFGSYGGTSNKDALSQTKQNILHFSGFPFSGDSELFQTKRKCLSKVPYPMLHSMCSTLLGNGPRTRNDSVEDLLSFLQKPTNESKGSHRLETNQEVLVKNDLHDPQLISHLKQQAIKGPYPIILIPKLSDSYVKQLLQEMRIEPDDKDSSSKLSDTENLMDVETTPKQKNSDVPNKRIQLKSLPKVVARVNKARRRTINLLHTLLYGRPGSDESHRLNILEFSGFSHYDARGYRRKKEFLGKMRVTDLNHMCSIFSLRVTSFSKEDKIITFLQHLKSSSLATKSIGTNLFLETVKLRPKNKEIIAKKTEVYSERKTRSYERPIKKLKEFEKIRRNIECANPKDLMELNDLLFLKPSNNLEIHQEILEFSSSSFRENSPEYYSRRTLLYYMSFEIIKKMAALLEITDWEEYKNPQDLATTLLRFLMDMKPSVKIRQRIKPPVHGLKRKVPSSVTHRPHLLRVQKDESGWENNANENPSATSAIHNSAYVKEGFHKGSHMQDTSVIVRRISESSYSFTDTRTNEPVTVSDSNSDESLSLYHFIKHPSDKQLEVTIREMIFTNNWSSTMGDLINRVFHCYPKLNLTYRLDFIKAKALEVIHEIQNTAKPCDDVI